MQTDGAPIITPPRDRWRAGSAPAGEGSGARGGDVAVVGAMRRGGFQPFLYPGGLGGAVVCALRIEQHDDDVAVSHLRLHDQAVPRLVDEAGFGQANLPVIRTG